MKQNKDQILELTQHMERGSVFRSATVAAEEIRNQRGSGTQSAVKRGTRVGGPSWEDMPLNGVLQGEWIGSGAK